MFDQNKRHGKATEEWERRFTENMVRLRKSNEETKSPAIPIFTGHTKNTQDILSHTRRLHNVFNSAGLLKTLDDVDLKEERRRSVINMANESLSGTELETWVEEKGKEMENDGKSVWEDWVVAFRKETLPKSWMIEERRKWASLKMKNNTDWKTFDTMVRSLRINLKGTSCYPEDKEVIWLYKCGIDKDLLSKVIREPRFEEGTLEDIREIIDSHATRITEEESRPEARKPSVWRPQGGPPFHKKTDQNPTAAGMKKPIEFYYDKKNSLPYSTSPDVMD
nr:hypothetical protein L203_00246 [Cryptococcus depauperatus CBS 7841]